MHRRALGTDSAQLNWAVDCFGGRRVFADAIMFIICYFRLGGRWDDVSMRGQACWNGGQSEQMVSTTEYSI